MILRLLTASLILFVSPSTSYSKDKSGFSRSERIKIIESFVSGGWSYSYLKNKHVDGFTRLIHRGGVADAKAVDEYSFCPIAEDGKSHVVIFAHEDNPSNTNSLRTGECAHIPIRRKATFLAKMKTGKGVIFFRHVQRQN